MSQPPTPSRLRVAVFLGGPSSEHDVSCASGLQVLDALDPERWEPVPVYLTRNGGWQVGQRPQPPLLRAAADGSFQAGPAPSEGSHPGRLLAQGLAALQERGPFDLVFLALHGAVGEDGTMQALLELADLPYTGSGVLASALAMDKVKAKEIYRQHGVPVARDRVVRRRELEALDSSGRRAMREEILRKVGLPCVVKPVVGGSSVATRRVREAGALEAALAEALDADERALVEECLVGVELTCAVLGGGPHEEAEALPVTEIAPPGDSFFDYHAKYTAGACSEITPARIDEAATRRVQELSVLAHGSLGCEGMSRTDFILRDGEPVALETNTIPGLTSTSLLPQAAAAAGLSFPRLLDRLLDSALLREKRRRGR